MTRPRARLAGRTFRAALLAALPIFAVPAVADRAGEPVEEVPEEGGPAEQPRDAEREQPNDSPIEEPYETRPGELRREAEDAAGQGDYNDERRSRIRVPRRNRDLTSQIRAAGEDEEFHSTPSPSVTPAPRKCLYYRTGGWLQPTQGVFQDDALFPKVTHGIGGIVPTKGPQLEQIDERGTYMAWLPMIAGRDTVIIGAQRYRKKDGSVAPASEHHRIVVRGRGNCTRGVPVRMRFRLEDAAGSRNLWVSPVVGVAPLEGPPAASETDFELRYMHGDGIPPRDVGPFRIEGKDGSPYSLAVDLIREDSGLPTGLRVSVGGTVEAMQPPVVKVVPLVLNDYPVSDAETDGLDLFAERLARGVTMFLPDYYPLPPASITAFAGKTLIATDLDPAKDATPDSLLQVLRDPEIRRQVTQDLLEARVSDRLGTAGMLGGADRIVAVVRDSSGGGSDMDRLADNAAGLIGSTKVVYVAVYPAEPPLPGERPRTGPASHLETVTARLAGAAAQNRGPGRIVHIVAHELAHSLPDKLWSGSGDARHSMLKSCERNYHNNGGGWANGMRLTVGGQPMRNYQYGVTSFMGPSSRTPRWVDQCTYAHLISAMRNKPDPELLLVRATLANLDGQTSASLGAGYDVLGIGDIESSASGSWSLRTRDRKGRILSSYPFEPVWESEENVPRRVVSAIHRIPASPDVGMIEVLHGSRVLTTRNVSARRPTLTVAPPTPGASYGTARLKWTARAQGNGMLLATVLYSADGGRTFDERIFEKPVSQAAAVRLHPEASEHVFKVIVTDGSRSTEKTVRMLGTSKDPPKPALPKDGEDW